MSRPLPISDIRVVHATDRYAVIDKPAGLLSVRGKGPDNQDCAAVRVATLFPRSTGPLVVHRLDMDTSGLMVFGLDPEAQRDLSAQFEHRRVAKRYTALVDGVLEAETGLIDAPMRLDVERRPYQVVDPALGRPARTRYTVMAVETDRTRIGLEPLTGRTHQLRVHMAHIGHAIFGDVLYGPQPRTAKLAPRLCLHAAGLGFREPGSGAPVQFSSVVPF